MVLDRIRPSRSTGPGRPATTRRRPQRPRLPAEARRGQDQRQSPARRRVAIDIGVAPFVDELLAGQVGHRDRHVRVTEVEAEDERRRASPATSTTPGRPRPVARPCRLLDRPVRRRSARDERPDPAERHPGQPGRLGTGHRPVVAQDLQQPLRRAAARTDPGSTEGMPHPNAIIGLTNLSRAGSTPILPCY